MDTLPLPDHGWAFKCEGGSGVAADPVANDVLRLPRQVAFHNLNEQNQARANRRIGVADEVLVTGKFVAILPNYKSTVPKEDRHEFWLGRVVQIDQEQRMVRVRYWHTGVKKNASAGGTAKYKQWHGRDGQYDWLPVRRLLLQIDSLTEKTRSIKATYRRRIHGVLTARGSDEDDEDDEGDDVDSRNDEDDA